MQDKSVATSQFWNVRQVQYECAMAFFQQFVYMFTQTDVKEAQSAVHIDDDDTRNES